jgi:hypothetical protein
MSVVAVAACGVLLTGGCVSAAAKTPAATRAPAAASIAAPTGGKANIMIYGVNTDGAYWHGIISGVIGDYGPAVSIYPDGKLDPAHNSEMELRLTRGSFRLSIAALDKAFVKATRHEPIYPKTCTDLISVTGTTPHRGGLRHRRLPRNQWQLPGHHHTERGRGEAVPAKRGRVPRAADHGVGLGDHLALTASEPTR